jgi:hypothetical protein
VQEAADPREYLDERPDPTKFIDDSFDQHPLPVLLLKPYPWIWLEGQE